MPLPDKHSGMVNRLCHTRLEHKCLEASLEEVLHSKSQDIIKLVLALIQQTVPVHPSQKGFTLENPAGVLPIKGQKHSSSITDAAEGILNPPKLPLAA